MVTGQRLPLDEIAERTLNEVEIADYGAGTIGELVDEVAAESGEGLDNPVVLVNGERVTGFDDVSDYPVETISRLEVLPRGSGNSVGASADQRVYNIVLRDRAQTFVGRAAYGLATDGAWASRRADVTLTRINRPTRFNVALRVSSNDRLLESDRDIVQPPPFLTTDYPLDILVPEEADLGRFRTLRPSGDSYQLTASLASRLTPWLRASTSARLRYTKGASLLGLPQGLFLLAASSPWSTFHGDVAVGRLGDSPLERRTGNLSGKLNFSLDADRAGWRLNLLSSLEFGRRRTRTELQLDSSSILDPEGRNPLTDPLLDLIVVDTRRIVSRTGSGSVLLTANRDLFDLPAGPVGLTLSGGYDAYEVRDETRDPEGEASDRFRQRVIGASATFDLPIASRTNGFLPFLGELAANAEFGWSDVSGLGALDRQTYSLRWRPAAWLRAIAIFSKSGTPHSRELLLEPVLTTPGIRYYDPVRDETVEVAEISGGIRSLSAQQSETRRLGINIAPKSSINLRLHGEYTELKNRNFLSALPPANAAVIAAFPDRFVRDSEGVLTQVDARPVQFASRSREQLRYGFSFSRLLMAGRDDGVDRSSASTEPEAPETDSVKDATEDSADVPNPGPRGGIRLHVTGSHTYLLRHRLVVAAGGPAIDLLSPNSLGLVGGGRPRHEVAISLGLNARGSGVRLAGQWRSASFVNLATDERQQSLRFSPTTTINLRAFTDPSRLFPNATWLKGSRFTASVVNLTNERQDVRSSDGPVPLTYQPAYLDPIGRTVEFELRKVF